MSDVRVYAAVCLVLFIASALQGVTGFGFGTLSMAILPLLMGARFASVLVAVLALFNVGYLAWHYRASVHWRTLGGLALGSLAGVPLGVHWLRVLPEVALRRAIGAAVLLYCFYHVWQTVISAQRESRLPEWLSVPVGIVAGTLSGAINSGGPPAIFFVYQRIRQREMILGTLNVYFWLLTVGKVMLLLWARMIPSSTAVYAGSLPLIWLGSHVGVRIARRLRPKVFRHVIASALAFLGLVLLLIP